MGRESKYKPRPSSTILLKQDKQSIVTKWSEPTHEEKPYHVKDIPKQINPKNSGLAGTICDIAPGCRKCDR
jgi:hypothetical protein